MKIAMLSRFCVALAVSALLCGSALPALATPAITTTTLAVSSAGSVVTTVSQGAVITLVATVQSGAAAITTGRVNFCVASATYCIGIHLLATAQLTNAGTATYRFIPGVGSHAYKAVFAATTANSASSSASSELTVIRPSNAIFASAGSIIKSGTPGDYSVTATVLGYADLPGEPSPTGALSFVDTSKSNNLLGTAALNSGTAALSWRHVESAQNGRSPQSMTVADFNGDGIPDLAETDSDNRAVLVFLGNGKGSFTAVPSSLRTGTYPRGIVAADFNGDGIMDLAVANETSATVSIFLGLGDGAFAPVTPTQKVGSYPQAIAVADFNGDGKPDLVVTSQSSNSSLKYGNLTVLLGNGDGTFTASSTSPKTGLQPYDIAVGDFNGDGIADLAVANFEDFAFTVLLGKGDGTFRTAASNASGGFAESMVASDFNGDGIADLALTSSNTVSVMLGNGDGSFALAPQGPLTATSPRLIRTADFNGDGYSDLAVYANATNTLTIFFGNGDGTFTRAPGPYPGNGVNDFVVADLNGDGLPDLSLVSYYSETPLETVLTEWTATATATLNGIAPVGVGSHNVEARFPGDATYSASHSGATNLVVYGALASLSSTSEVFGSENVGVQSPAQAVTLTNTGNAALTFGSIALTGAHPSQFLTSNNCGSSLAASASCTINLRFYPHIPGLLTASLTLTDNAGDSPQSIALQGDAIGQPAVKLSSSTVPFGSENVGVESPALTVTLTDTGSDVLTIGTIALTGAQSNQFLTSNNCSASLVAGASCTLRIRFYPKIAGTLTAAIVINDNATGSPQSVALSGTAIGPPLVTLSATSLAFGVQTINTESAAQTVTLTNTGGQPLSITSIALTGVHPSQYITSTTCGATVAPASSCSIRVRFYPRTKGVLAAAVTVTDNAADSHQSTSLSGTGVAP